MKLKITNPGREGPTLEERKGLRDSDQQLIDAIMAELSDLSQLIGGDALVDRLAASGRWGYDEIREVVSLMWANLMIEEARFNSGGKYDGGYVFVTTERLKLVCSLCDKRRPVDFGGCRRDGCPFRQEG